MHKNWAVMNAFYDFLTARGYEVFATTNAYKFLLYAREIAADILIIGSKNDFDRNIISGLQKNGILSRSPLIVIADMKNQKIYPEVAHYLPLPINLEKFVDIVESYCDGGKQHDVLLAERFIESDAFDFPNKNSVFKVHNIDAANLYLKKNNPKNVIINLKKYDNSSINNAPHAFYVDKKDNIQDREKFLS